MILKHSKLHFSAKFQRNNFIVKDSFIMVVFNGKFLSQKVTGVQRYAREILRELDKLLPSDADFVLAVDKYAEDVPEYRNIRIVKAGRLSGNMWEQISLPLYVLRHGAVCVNLCNMAPVLTPHIVVIHDVSYKVNKSFFSRKFAAWYNLVFALIIRRIRRIVTVSQFSRDEICRAYRHSFSNITVTYNGWQHFRNIPYDPDALGKYGLSKKEYYFAMSSMAPNKNFRWIAENARLNPGTIYAVSGGVNQKVFGNGLDFEIPPNLKILGYISDSEAKTLMSECRAFIFPTFYEGFGIPPLEALAAGADIVVSDASCMREIFGDCAHYVDPNNPGVDIDALLSAPCRSPEGLFEKYSWEKSAEELLNVICQEAER